MCQAKFLTSSETADFAPSAQALTALTYMLTKISLRPTQKGCGLDFETKFRIGFGFEKPKSIHLYKLSNT